MATVLLALLYPFTTAHIAKRLVCGKAVEVDPVDAAFEKRWNDAEAAAKKWKKKKGKKVDFGEPKGVNAFDGL